MRREQPHHGQQPENNEQQAFHAVGKALKIGLFVEFQLRDVLVAAQQIQFAGSRESLRAVDLFLLPQFGDDALLFFGVEVLGCQSQVLSGTERLQGFVRGVAPVSSLLLFLKQ